MSRLEEIKTHLERFMTPKNKPCLFREDAEWVISRVEELEEVVERQLATIGYYEELTYRYKEALEFYADENQYEEDNHGSLLMPDYRVDIQDDYGEKARQALKGDTE